MSELIDILLSFPDLMKVPIVFDEKRIMVGYNNEELRKFLSKSYRKLSVQDGKEFFVKKIVLLHFIV